jgi:lipoprotein-anchoring transpeptidase ErfK/SrfK
MAGTDNPSGGKQMFKFFLRASLAALMIAQTHAAQIQFASDTFTILGGIQDTQVASATGPTPLPTQSFNDDVSGPNRALINFETNLSPGSILVRTAERKLYFILPDGQAIMYRVGVGREGFSWSGRNEISRKAVWPKWTPPKVMIKREAERGHIIPDFMEGGSNNPLGARALYIGGTDFRIHGTTQPWSIGHAVSSGCIRMLNEHVIDLYDRVKIGAKIVVE